MRRGRLNLLVGADAAACAAALDRRGARLRGAGSDVIRVGPATAGVDPGGIDPGDDPGAPFDLTAVLRRRPGAVLMHGLSQLQPSGGDKPIPSAVIATMLDAGIDVVATLTVEQIVSQQDVAATFSEEHHDVVPLPDSILRTASSIELIDAASGGPRVPVALRVLAMRLVADELETETASRGDGAVDLGERVLVTVTAGAGGDELLRRAARLARRSHSDLIGVHVAPSADMRLRADVLEARRRLIGELGGTYREVHGADVAEALASVARAERITQVVLGSTRRMFGTRLGRGSVADRLLRLAPDVGVCVVATRDPDVEGGARRSTRSPRPHPLSGYRRRLSWILLLLGVPLLNGLLMTAGDAVDLPVALLCNLLLTVAVAGLGGFVPALVAALVVFLTVNYLFVAPTDTFMVADAAHLVALAAFVAVALVTAALVDRLARRNSELEEAVGTSAALVRSSADLLGERDPLPGLLSRLQGIFGFESVALLRRGQRGWSTQASVGSEPPTRPAGGWALRISEDGSAVVVVRGGEVSGSNRVILGAFMDQLALALERAELKEIAERSEVLADSDALRRGLLLAVSHDLRTPLAGIKASVTSLMARDVEFDKESTAAFLGVIDDEVDRLDRVIGNLLDAGRLESGTVPVDIRPAALDDVVAAALHSLNVPDGALVVDVAPELPLVDADGALLERAVANVVANALAVRPPDTVVRVEAVEGDDVVELRVIDCGPGIAVDERAAAVQAFQRLGDRSTQAGVGLGLAIAEGFAGAMGATFALGETPGGGLTVAFGFASVPDPPLSGEMVPGVS